MVRPTGFEPAAFRVGAERSIHLSYGRKYRCLFRRARGRGISFRLLCRRTLYPPAEGKNLLAKVHPSYGRKYRCLFRRARGAGDIFSPALQANALPSCGGQEPSCEGPPELRTQIQMPFRACGAGMPVLLSLVKEENKKWMPAFGHPLS